MNVIPEAHRVHFIRYLRMYMSTLLDIYVFICPLYLISMYLHVHFIRYLRIYISTLLDIYVFIYPLY
jgi:hypothetical protein